MEIIMKLIYDHGGDTYTTGAELDFSVNTNPLGVSGIVKKVYFDSAGVIEKYPDNDCRSLREKLAEYENGIDGESRIRPENIFCGNGAADIIYKLVYALKPKTALITAPAFSEYENALAAAGCGISYHYLNEQNDFVLGRGILSEKRADMVFICNPNNPTGRAADGELIAAAAKKCRDENSVLVVDECFADLSEIRSARGNAVVIKAFTKTFAMAGLRLGYVIGDVEIINKIKKVSPPWNVGTVALRCAEAALEDQGYRERSGAFIKSERGYLTAALNSIKGIKAFESDTCFILFKADKDLGRALLRRGILIRDCSGFRGLGEGFFRIGLKGHNENIRLLEEIEKWQCR